MSRVKVVKFFLLNILSVCLLLISTTVIQAQESVIELSKEKTNPEDGFSFLAKRLGEKFKLFIYSPLPEKKEDTLKKLATTRLAELKYIIEKGDMNNFEKSTIRYSTTVGEWVEYINKKKLTGQKQHAQGVLNSHIPVVKILIEKYNPTTAEWRFVKHDLDYLNIYISQLN